MASYLIIRSLTGEKLATCAHSSVLSDADFLPFQYAASEEFKFDPEEIDLEDTGDDEGTMFITARGERLGTLEECFR